MGYKLFLDDTRIPVHCVTYMHSRVGRLNPIYLERDWVICRNYKCFIATIKDMGLPNFISFDHDLADEHYASEGDTIGGYKEETGHDCAKWLVDYCIDQGVDLPDFAVHSMNPVGSERIISLLKTFKRTHNDRERI
jgi:hypothetical protein